MMSIGKGDGFNKHSSGKNSNLWVLICWKHLGRIGSNHPLNLISPVPSNIVVFFILE